MKKFNSLAYYYTLLVITVMVFGGVFLLPHPFRIIQPLVLIPSFLYLWLNVTSPDKATESEWSTRAAIIVIGLAVLGIVGYVAAAKLDGETQETTQSNEETIEGLRGELDELKSLISSENETIDSSESGETLGEDNENEQISDLLKYLDEKSETSPTPSPQATNQVVGTVQIINKAEVDVYQQRSSSSRIIGVVTQGTSYPFFESLGGWYLIEYATDKQGWVQAANTVEINE